MIVDYAEKHWETVWSKKKSRAIISNRLEAHRKIRVQQMKVTYL